MITESRRAGGRSHKDRNNLLTFSLPPFFAPRSLGTIFCVLVFINMMRDGRTLIHFIR